MRIVIDMQGALTHGSRSRGIGRYTLDLVSAMVRLRGESVHLSMNNNFHAQALRAWNDIVGHNSSLTRSAYRTPTLTNYYETSKSTRRKVSESIVRRHVAGLFPDVLLFSSLFEAAPPDYRPIDLKQFPARVSAVILYDLIPLIFESEYLPGAQQREWYFDAIESLKTADLLLAISECAKRDAVQLLKVPPERIVVISAAANSKFMPIDSNSADTSALKARLGLSRDFVMYVAGADARKNLRGIIDVVATLPYKSRRKLQILLVTNADAAYRASLTELTYSLGLSSDTLVIVNEVSDVDLVLLLNISRALVFPSLYEGFGLPVLEAMQCGTPVVVARTSSLSEIVNRSDLLYDPTKPEEGGHILCRLLSDVDFRSNVSRWGVERAGTFSWDATARLALRALDDAMARAKTTAEIVTCNELLDLDGARREIADLLRLAPAEDASIGSFVADLLFSLQSFREGQHRLLIDATQCAQSDTWTGIQRVVRKLTAAFYRGGADEAAFVPVAVRLGGMKPVAAMGHVAVALGSRNVATPYEVEIRRGDDLFMLDSTWSEYETCKTQFDRIRAVQGRVFTCIYDLIPELHPEVCGEGMPQAHARWLSAAAVESDGLICISRAVADELLAYILDHHLPYRRGLHIGWFHCGSDIDEFHGVRSVRDDVRAAFRGEEPTFLAVATLEPRKCHALAIDAFDLLWERGVAARLVFIGAQGWKIEALIKRIRMHPEHEKRLFWFDGASDNDVSYAYKSATAIVSMSLAEGFGLPLAEAARLNKPVICSDIPVFREVGGEGAVYFTPLDTASMAQTVEDWLGGRLKTDPTKVSRTSWMQAARRIREIIYDGDWYMTLS